uniref:G_PROTEIN_RECEP_F1_2 domain-containing protein n=1 Tax=Dracunculus medinensis TaxID=318479 RepID=A0A0N4UC55_DRAME
LGLLFASIDRLILTDLYKTGHICKKTPLICSTRVYVWFRLIGAIWPPAIEICIGIERTFCVFCPIWYSKHSKKFAIVVVFAMLIALLLVFKRKDEEIEQGCNRKGTFTNGYALFLYFAEVYCFEQFKFIFFFGGERRGGRRSKKFKIMELTTIKRFLLIIY